MCNVRSIFLCVLSAGMGVGILPSHAMQKPFSQAAAYHSMLQQIGRRSFQTWKLPMTFAARNCLLQENQSLILRDGSDERAETIRKFGLPGNGYAPLIVLFHKRFDKGGKDKIISESLFPAHDVSETSSVAQKYLHRLTKNRFFGSGIVLPPEHEIADRNALFRMAIHAAMQEVPRNGWSGDALLRFSDPEGSIDGVLQGCAHVPLRIVDKGNVEFDDLEQNSFIVCDPCMMPQDLWSHFFKIFSTALFSELKLLDNDLDIESNYDDVQRIKKQLSHLRRVHFNGLKTLENDMSLVPCLGYPA